MNRPEVYSVPAAESIPGMPRLEIVYKPISWFREYPRNPRRNDAAVDRMCASIREFGFAVPMLCRSTGEIVDGHLRLKGARKVGLAELPVVLCDHWTDAQVKTFRLMVNRSVTWAEWDETLLAMELQEIQGLDFDLSLTGFEDDELARLLAAQDAAEGLTDEDAVPELRQTPVSATGDLFVLGNHRLLVGDATDGAAAAPKSPMVDAWMGDDWFHYGAFRQTNLDYLTQQTTKQDDGSPVVRGALDDYETFRQAGSAGDYMRARGLDQLPWARKMIEHPAYDAFWQGQALDKLIAEKPPQVPTMWLQGLWDQEDMWGAIHSYLALKDKGQTDHNYLAMGPWRHSQVNADGYNLGPLKWDGDTTLQFRRDVLKPFFDQYLKDGAPKVETPPVFIYNTGENHWDRLKSWPLACEKGCPSRLKPLYLQAGFGLGFAKPAGTGSDSYVSDPAKPVPYIPRPIRLNDPDRWRSWLVTDQRSVADRTDVLTYQTPVLTSPVRLSGAPIADLLAQTTGTDADWVVKLIDVYPEEIPSQPEMGGYQLAIAMDIFRGRYRESFEHPSAIPAGKTQEYKFTLSTVNHVFEPGHRIMVQIQSSWFPLYDRNPQKFVENIFNAKPADYTKATQTVMRSAAEASAVWLPVVE